MIIKGNPFWFGYWIFGLVLMGIYEYSYDKDTKHILIIYVDVD